MALAGATTLRDVIAFPKSTTVRLFSSFLYFLSFWSRTPFDKQRNDELPESKLTLPTRCRTSPAGWSHYTSHAMKMNFRQMYLLGLAIASRCIFNWLQCSSVWWRFVPCSIRSLQRKFPVIFAFSKSTIVLQIFCELSVKRKQNRKKTVEFKLMLQTWLQPRLLAGQTCNEIGTAYSIWSPWNSLNLNSQQ